MKKSQSSGYLLQLDLKTTTLLSILSVISMALVFYLGMSYGKSTRNTEPGQVVIRTLEKSGEKANGARSSLFDPSEGNKTVESYEKTLQGILNNKETPTAEASADANPLPAAATPKNTASKKEVPAKKAAVQKKDAAVKHYTVQLLATSKYKKANDLITLLKKKKFEAYIQNIPIESGGTLYRVRVGRDNRASAEAVKTKLEKELKEFGNLKIVEVD